MLLAAAVVLGVHAAVNYTARGSRLARRVDVLEATRSGAVDAQDAELRRIERDLHDGAQARLVALGMSLGLAEQKLASDPEGAQQLVAEARAGVGRGAARSCATSRAGSTRPCSPTAASAPRSRRSPTAARSRSTVSVELDERLAAGGRVRGVLRRRRGDRERGQALGRAPVAVEVRRQGDVLEVAVDGRRPRRRRPAGGGLTGLRRRVEALDGRLAVTSPPGGPTIVRAELPCAS